MTELWRTFKELADSKKFIVFLVTVILVLSNRFGLNLETEAVQKVVYLAVAYLVGQGIADVANGKKTEPKP